VYESVKGLLPGVSRTTVYRVLDLLVRLHVAIRINSPSARVRYDADVNRHHHAICQACEAVVDLHAPEFDGISLPREATAEFSFNDYSVNFTGICQTCQKGEGTDVFSH
jgi:Fur family peroxide stress response transcriptional regulator